MAEKVFLGSIESPPFYIEPKGQRISNVNGTKEISSGFWYEKAEDWYAITAFSAATRTIYMELQILMNYEAEISKLLDNKTKVIYGIGNGDTESLMIEWDLERNKYSEIVVIDANRTFLENFVEGMNSLVLDYDGAEVQVALLTTLFEKTSARKVTPENRKHKNSVHMCVGNTFGNFEQGFIFSLLSKNMKKGDLLMLGLQLLRNPEVALKQYSGNKLYNRWISHVGRCAPSQLNWKWNPENNQVEAWKDDTLVFRSKKYSINELNNLARNYGLKPLKNYEYKNSTVSIFEKVI